jgi:translation elongation factor P/translation initiation factor 5A
MNTVHEMGNVLPFVKYNSFWSVQIKSRTADYSYDIHKKVYFMTLRKYTPLLVSPPCRGRGACEFQ